MQQLLENKKKDCFLKISTFKCQIAEDLNLTKLSIFEEVVVEISKCPEKSCQLFFFAN